MSAVCQHCILGDSQLVLQRAPCSGKYAVKQQAEWHSRHHRYNSFREKLVCILFHMEKALGGFFWNALLQPQRAVWNNPLHSCWAGTTAHQCAPLPHIAAQRNLWIHLVEMIVPFLFLPFTSNTCWNNTNSMPFGCCYFILLNSKITCWAYPDKLLFFTATKL